MFCRLNPYALPFVCNTLKSNSQVQKLLQLFGVALRHSIQTFKQKRNVEQKQVSVAQKSASLTKMSQSQEKIQKSDIQIPAPCQEQKEITNNCQQQENRKTEKDQQIQDINKKVAVLKPKRRIIRKIKRQKQEVKVKKQQNMFKLKNVIREDLITLTADIPPVKGIPSRQIIYRIQQLKRRQVTSWEMHDPTTQRRKRFLRHLE